ncbi:flagellar motor protein MotB [Paenibacillus agricola]|uniref:OmpA family protein n=1 Tax=Paenibacillus agricola TaxID=2716264 RepID=A0ABX0JBW3_9BACL|nr:flagellar motor protein MotB [Paenibacillus agricola]NHN33914.1 OmpA family protein [Paenibacillus agricola]
MIKVARNRKKRVENENHERWLITYADLITLLLIFFVIMYAMSQVDTKKYEVLAQSLNLEYTKSESIMPQGAGVLGSLNPAQANEGNLKEDDNKDKKEQVDKEVQLNELREKQFQDLMEKIQQYIQQQNLQSQIFVANTSRGINVTLNDLFLFDLGRADLKRDAYPILDKLSTLLPTLDSVISIEGHTDNVPLATGSLFKDNWRLSSERSLSVLRYFTDTMGLEPKKFMSSAFADTHPVADNSTPENRSKNRRVEIIVLREAPQQ